MSQLSGAYHRAKQRTSDVVRDLIDMRVRRVCCARTDEAKGGYRHWRCGRRRGHDGPHRFVNYVWPSDGLGEVEYDPIDPRDMRAFPADYRQPSHRYGSPTRADVRRSRAKVRASA